MGQGTSKEKVKKPIKYKTADKAPKGAAGKKHAEADPRPYPDEKPGQFVSRCCGDYYVDPFLNNLRSWSLLNQALFPDPFPAEGGADESQIKMMRRMCDPNCCMNDPSWNLKYMKECCGVWMQMLKLYNKGPKKASKSEAVKAMAATAATETPDLYPDPGQKPAVQLYPSLPSGPPPCEEDDEILGCVVLRKCTNPPSSTTPGKSSPDADDDVDDKDVLDREIAVQKQKLADLKLETTELTEKCGKILKALSDGNLTLKEAKEVLLPVSSYIYRRKSLIPTQLEGPIQIAYGQLRKFIKKEKKRIAENAAKSMYDDTDVSSAAKNTRSKSSVDLAVHFMLIGLIKPPDMVALQTLIASLPDPAVKPAKFVRSLQQATRYIQLSGADYRYILSQTMPHVTETELIEAIKYLNPENDMAPTAAEYMWANPINTADFYKELLKFLQTLHHQRIDLNAIQVCKQKQGETIIAYLKRFHDCWKNDALLPEEGDQFRALYVTTFLNNCHPETSYILRLTASSDLMQMTPDDFKKMIHIKYAANVFSTSTKQKPVQMILNFVLEGTEEVYDDNEQTSGDMMMCQGQGQRGQGGPRDRRQDKCYKCGGNGHWARDCRGGGGRSGGHRPRHEGVNSGPPPAKIKNPPACNPNYQQPQPGYNPGPSADPRYPMKWNQSRR